MKKSSALVVIFALCAFPPITTLADDMAKAAAFTAFSKQKPGANLPKAWAPISLPKVTPTMFELVDDGGTTVLKAIADKSAGTVSHKLQADAAKMPMLEWRWKIDAVVDAANLKTKEGDDFAARVYVFFDVPASTLPFGTRVKMKAAKVLYGAEIPTAALCYVWDNTHPVGTSVWNPYTDRVRTIVLQSGNGKAGRWQTQSVNLAEDFKAAFGMDAPAITGIAIGNDTDNTQSSAVAYFGDFALRAP